MNFSLFCCLCLDSRGANEKRGALSAEEDFSQHASDMLCVYIFSQRGSGPGSHRYERNMG